MRFASLLSFALLLALPACSHSVAYRGTGSLQWSGDAASDLAVHDVELTLCSGAPTPDSKATSFALLSIGGTCILQGTGDGDAFQPDAGQECVLPFANGPRSLQVTDATVRYGQTSRSIRGNAVIDSTYIEVSVGGNDAVTGRHALYRFAGAESREPDAQPRCQAARTEAARLQSQL